MAIDRADADARRFGDSRTGASTPEARTPEGGLKRVSMSAARRRARDDRRDREAPSSNGALPLVAHLNSS